MALYSRRPKLKSTHARGTKLYITDDNYLEALLTSKEYTTASDAIADLVNEAIRIRKAKDLGKDETLYAVTKKQEMVVHEGTKPLVEKLDQLDRNISGELGHFGLTLTDLIERITMLERQAARQSSAVNRLLEITVICYGILRHYVLGIFVTKLTKLDFQTYADGFKKRLEVFRLSVRSGNSLLEGDYENLADEFAHSLVEATSVQMPASNEEQILLQQQDRPVLSTNALHVSEKFPKN